MSLEKIHLSAVERWKTITQLTSREIGTSIWVVQKKLENNLTNQLRDRRKCVSQLESLPSAILSGFEQPGSELTKRLEKISKRVRQRMENLQEELTSQIVSLVLADNNDFIGYPLKAQAYAIEKRFNTIPGSHGRERRIVGLLSSVPGLLASKEKRLFFTILKDFFGERIFVALTLLDRHGSRIDDSGFGNLLLSPLATRIKIAELCHGISKLHLLEDGQTRKRLRSSFAEMLTRLGADGPSCEKPIIFKNGEWIREKTRSFEKPVFDTHAIH